MSPVITLVFLILGISALDIEDVKDWPRVPSFYPAGFPLMPSGNASTCQNLCKMSAGCQYFVWMEGYGHQCSLIDKPMTAAMEHFSIVSGLPDGAPMTNILALSEYKILNMHTTEEDAETCYNLCQESPGCHHWIYGNFTEHLEDADARPVCYLDSRTDLQGVVWYPVKVAGDRDTPPRRVEIMEDHGGVRIKTKGAKKKPTKKSKPSRVATKRPTKKPKQSIRRTTTTATTASGDASTTATPEMHESTTDHDKAWNIYPCDKELGKKNSHKRKKTAPKRKKPLLELEEEDGVVVINDDPEVRTEANMGDPYTRL